MKFIIKFNAIIGLKANCFDRFIIKVQKNEKNFVFYQVDIYMKTHKIVLNKRRSTIRKKVIFLYLETELDGDHFKNFQKTFPFFGQVGVHESAEKYLEIVSGFYKPLYISYFKLNNVFGAKTAPCVYCVKKI